MYLLSLSKSRRFSGGARMRRRPRRRCAYNGPRVCEPARRAQAVALLLLSNRRDRRVGCRRPADDQREEACVNTLLYAGRDRGGARPRQDGEAAVFLKP